MFEASAMKFSLQSLYTLYRSGIRNRKYRWWIILGTLVYLLSPLDIAPDLLPIVGQIDDVVLVTLLLTEVSQLVLEHFQNRNRASGTQEESDSTAKTVEVEVVTLD
ncbi:Protein of unknown function DUF1232 [Synechocystis sp. LKSZ1]